MSNTTSHGATPASPASGHRLPWDALLIGGPSGVGKSSISYLLAQQWRVGITEVDDIVIALEELTTPTQQPEIHFWRTHPDAAAELPVDDILVHQINLARALAPALRAVIANHIETSMPVILDGDYLLPEFCVDTDSGTNTTIERVRSVFVYEDDEAQIVSNFLQREPGAGPQHKRAQVSWRYGQWLQEECARYDQIAIRARPWDTLAVRIERALQADTS